MDVANGSTYTHLYGGALGIQLPGDFNDLSDIMPIEDNQEVFTDMKYDAKLIIEVLECLDLNDETALSSNFKELAETQNATDVCIEKCGINAEVAPKIRGSNIIKSYLKGTQHIIPSKRADEDREEVTLFMVHLRLKEHDADILVTLNVPNKAANTDSYEDVLNYHTNVFENMNRTLEIRDLSLLFG
ncbi:unnamed protein product [Moneuplotes crassus]|uniref:Ran guanine nucleotide release factor n=1 Tax=Euplotes crassus TaxID=5936 RepID=A0AAD1Y053_EUPCR|nr:unnamed protein product [Moneuplotes crassus]